MSLNSNLEVYVQATNELTSRNVSKFILFHKTKSKKYPTRNTQDCSISKKKSEIASQPQKFILNWN